MIIRKEPTKEERRRLYRIRLLDFFCLGVAALIIVLTIVAFVYHQGGVRMMGAVMLLGVILNLSLAARSYMGQVKIAAVGALSLAAVCAVGLAYLILFR